LKNKITISLLCVTLVLSGAIIIPNAFAENAESFAEMWINGHITDDEFLTSIEHLIETKNITKTSQLPDWLVNNAGWWAARIFTNSDFDFNPGYVKEEIYPCEDEITKGFSDFYHVWMFDYGDRCIKATYNHHGLRSSEFEKENPDNIFRIFTVGGSTTFGNGAVDSETWPVYLQQIIDKKITGQKIEVINAGASGGGTVVEYKFIKTRLVSFDPDLIIMYDGWNEFQAFTPVVNTIKNWESVCKLGNNEGFDTIIVVQPLPLTGNRVLTEQEIINSFPVFQYLKKSQQYVDGFEELDDVCTKTADFRRIFDYVQEPIYYDNGHTMSFGNKVIAENIFSVISPIYFGETYSVTYTNLNSEPGTGVVYAVGADLSNRNFDNLNLQNAVFDKADLSNTSFKNTNIDGARFAFANLNNSNLLDRTDLSNINLAGTDLSKVTLKGKDLSGSILTGVDLSYKDLTGTMLTDVDLSNTRLIGVDLSGMDLTDIMLAGVDLSNSILTGVDLSGRDLTGIMLTGVDLSGMDFSGTILTGADLSNTNLTGVDLSGMNLTGAKLTNADLSNVNLSGTILRGADLTGSKLAGVNLSDIDLTETKIHSIDLSGMNLLDIIYLTPYLLQDELDWILNKIELNLDRLTKLIYPI
jgi:uncharacterized protein YjbI with pentapeptide repeats